MMRPTAVFLDLGLPGLSGLDVARQLRRRAGAERLVLVAITGWGHEAYREQTRVASFDRHLVKPVDPDLLKKILRELPAPERRQAE
jgi:DNA-binding response OmpR family regulator